MKKQTAIYNRWLRQEIRRRWRAQSRKLQSATLLATLLSYMLLLTGITIIEYHDAPKSQATKHITAVSFQTKAPAFRSQQTDPSNSIIKNKTIMNEKIENQDLPGTEGEDTTGQSPDKRRAKVSRMLIFALMGIAFAGCMYLIFKPSEVSSQQEQQGLMEVVPDANEELLATDKEKAYEQESLQQKQAARRNELQSLSDYWIDHEQNIEEEHLDQTGSTINKRHANPALESYRNSQDALNNFYQQPDPRTAALEKEVSELKQQLTRAEQSPSGTMDDQLALMEKSYQMAAKYLPGNSEPVPGQAVPVAEPQQQEAPLMILHKAGKEIISSLPTSEEKEVSQGISDPELISIYSTGLIANAQQANSVKAEIDQDVTITGYGEVSLRLLANINLGTQQIKKGSILTAQARLQGSRIDLSISSYYDSGNVYPIKLKGYGLDGMQGLAAPQSQEMNALAEIGANMGQAGTTSIMMASGAGPQLVSDLTRGVLQGVSGYLSKKVRTPKVTLQAGVQVLLIPSN